MDQTDANVKRIASLEARVSELEAALEERDAMSATAVKLARQAALAEAAQMLLAMARRGAVNLAEAARIIAELASDARKPPLS